MYNSSENLIGEIRYLVKTYVSCRFKFLNIALLFRIEPILTRIQEDRTAILCPEIDNIDKNTLQYGGTGSYSVGGFWWSLHFAWRPIPEHETKRRKSIIDPIR